MFKISVIIPTHNRADLLPRAIKSVQNQTLNVHEIIVVSDGSTDSTNRVMQSICELDDRIKFVHYYPGINGNYARNKGIELATGDIIGFLDDDDEWLPEKVEKQINIFESDKNIGLVYTGQYCIYGSLNIMYITKPCNGGDLSKRIFIHNYPGASSQVMVKKTLLDQVGYFDLELEAMQDRDLWIRCCQKCKVGFVKDPCIKYYNSIGKKQISSDTNKYIRSHEHILKKYEPTILAFDRKLQQKIYSEIKLSVSIRCLRNNDGKLARIYIREAWKIKKTFKTIGLYCASFLPFKLVLIVRGHFK